MYLRWLVLSLIYFMLGNNLVDVHVLEDALFVLAFAYMFGLTVTGWYIRGT